MKRLWCFIAPPKVAMKRHNWFTLNKFQSMKRWKDYNWKSEDRCRCQRIGQLELRPPLINKLESTQYRRLHVRLRGYTLHLIDGIGENSYIDGTESARYCQVNALFVRIFQYCFQTFFIICSLQFRTPRFKQQQVHLSWDLVALGSVICQVKSLLYS